MHPLHSMYSLVATSKLKMAYLGVSTSTIYLTVIGTYLQRFLTVYASPCAFYYTALSLAGPRTRDFERHQTAWTCCCWSELIAQCRVFIHAEHVVHSAWIVLDTVLTLDVCMYVCMYVRALERKRLIGMT